MVAGEKRLKQTHRQYRYYTQGLELENRRYQRYGLQETDDAPELLAVRYSKYHRFLQSAMLGLGVSRLYDKSIDLVICETKSMVGMLLDDVMALQVYLIPFLDAEEWVPIDIFICQQILDWVFVEIVAQDKQGTERSLLYISQLLPTTRMDDVGYNTH